MPIYVSDFNVVASPLAEHALVHSCNFDFSNVEILDRDANWEKRKIKEAYHIRKYTGHNSLLNRDLGLEVDGVWNSIK